MKKLVFSFALFAVLMLMYGCTASKKITYFQNIDSISLAASKGLYDATIMPKDQLTITVNTTDPEAARPFNLTVNNQLGASGGMSAGNGYLQTYLVDNEGYINFPVVGKIHVVGLTKSECENLIKSKIQPYLARTEDPIVTVRMSSFRVTVIGLVNGPSVVPVTSEKMSIVEALASSGDLNLYGRRDNILLIREDENGQKHAARLNLTDANILNSPYYYLKQNDIIYVEPNKAYSRNASYSQSTTIWFSVISVLTSLTGFILGLVR